MADGSEHRRIAAVADLHCPRASRESIRACLAAAAAEADVILLGGDLTDYGKPDEAKIFVDALPTPARVPIVAVLGNHDYECGAQDEVERILKEAGITVLNGTAVEVAGIGIAGVKGFAGGFGDRALHPWGEPTLKRFVQETVDEALRLESALAKLQAVQRIVLLHYSPILDTVVGEPAEILPFLGSSRLEEPINRYGVTAVFHGHAHHGELEGRTRDGIPVYNVAMPLLLRRAPERPPIRFLDVPIAKESVLR